MPITFSSALYIISEVNSRYSSKKYKWQRMFFKEENMRRGISTAII